jgi:energy-coupling factor transport system permease protein
MDSRGFGRRGQLTRAQVLLGRVLSLGGLLLILIATYFLLATNATTLAVSLIATGVVALFFTIRLASRRNLRTRFRKQKARARDAIVALIGIAWIVSVVLI